MESLKIFSVLTFTFAELSCGKSENILCFNFHLCADFFQFVESQLSLVLSSCGKSKTIFHLDVNRGYFQIVESLKQFTVLTFTCA